MGIRGYIQVKKPEYGKQALSSWEACTIYDFLQDKEIDITGEQEGDTWEIYIDDNLRTLTKELLENKHNEDLNSRFADQYLRREDNAKSLGEFLNEGIQAADQEGDNYIIVDFF